MRFPWFARGNGSTARGESPEAVVHRRARELLDRSAERPGPDRTAEVEELARLHRLLEIARATTPPPRRSKARIASLALFGGALVAIASLMTGHVSTTEIELDVTTTGVSFVVAGPRAITPPLPATQLTVRGVRHAECPTLPALGPALLAGGVIAAIAADPASQLVVNSLAPGGGETAFALATTDVPRQLRLELAMPPGSAGAVEITASGPVRLGALADPVSFSGQTLTAVGDPGRALALEVTLDQAHHGNLVAGALQVRALAFARTDDESTTGQRLLTPRSGIVEGTLGLAALGDTAVKLAEGAFLELGCAAGELRRVAAADGGVRVRFHGSVCELRAGHAAYRRNLMPTWFDWLRAREPLKALWLATLWLFGIVASLLAWWRRPS